MFFLTCPRLTDHQLRDGFFLHFFTWGFAQKKITEIFSSINQAWSKYNVRVCFNVNRNKLHGVSVATYTIKMASDKKNDKDAFFCLKVSFSKTVCGVPDCWRLLMILFSSSLSSSSEKFSKPVCLGTHKKSLLFPRVRKHLLLSFRRVQPMVSCVRITTIIVVFNCNVGCLQYDGNKECTVTSRC
jgi:hypothetical protein